MTTAKRKPDNESLKKFQYLLRELFQFDCADLDFGIYRIINYKHDVIERFISDELPQAIIEELKCGNLADRAQATEELRDIHERILLGLGENAIDADGNLDEKFRETPLGKKYLILKNRTNRGLAGKALEINIFNHLYSFFSRYYEDGDYISKKRYSRRQRYSIPYNGEEIYLHWANSDQYYIKTAEYFHDYSYKAPNGVTVRFKLKAADMEQNNVKGSKRFFLPRSGEIAWDYKNQEIIIPFEYRPLTSRESIDYGNRNQQDMIINATLKEVPKSVKNTPEALAALLAERHANPDGQTVTFFEHHMRHYTRRNTSDFFIHKNLKGFLSRELDFYLKNEVLNLDEVQSAGEDHAEGWFQTMRIIRSVANRIISFLDQIENFQKMLWEKHKFVTETHYCVRAGIIDESFHSEVATCEAQWDEWQNLFGIDEEEPNLFNLGKDRISKRIDYLKNHPTLVLDTKHFSQKFVDRLLATFDGLDDMTDGLLLCSENFQAINLLLGKYREHVTCIHIDPPYNTQNSGFLYKNDYQHSSWLTMMENRISSGVLLLNKNGSFVCHIDENEHERLHLLFERIGIPNSGTIVWDKRNPMTGGGGIATQHEYIIWRAKNDDVINLQNRNIESILEKAKYLIEKYGGVSEKTKKEFSNWVRKNKKLSGGEKAYSKIDDEGRVYSSVSLRAPEPRTDPKFFEPLLHPVTNKPCPVPPNGFSRTPETLKAMIVLGEILFGPDETTQPRQKRFLTIDSKKQLSSVLPNAKKGKSDLDALGLENFPYCHSVSFYMQLLGAATNGVNDLVVDYFSGSGTTGHAVINLNREDAQERKFILVEMGEHFTTVMLPRIKKIMFSPEWKDGKPKRMATTEEIERSPRIVKYQRLESYEDSLNNIEFDDSAGQHKFKFDDYLIQYMLQWETKQSTTLLNIEKMSRPFSYKLHTHCNGETRETVADISETFNYLVGLQVRTQKVYNNEGHRYLVYTGKNCEKSEVTVIWRETEGWMREDYARDRDFVAGLELTAGADEIFVNGDSLIPDAQALEPLFKSRMFAGADT